LGENNERQPISSSEEADGRSDKSFESEEDMRFPFRYRPSSISTRIPLAGHDFPHDIAPLVPASFNMNPIGSHLEEMQMEIDDLRRQVLDLQSSRAFLSSQLADAKAEVSRAREGQRVAERKLMETEERKKRLGRAQDSETEVGTSSMMYRRYGQ
jgi:hypothetical protein